MVKTLCVHCRGMDWIANWESSTCFGVQPKKINTVVFFIHTVKNQDLWSDSNGTPLQYSCLENPMDGGAWWAAIHGVAKSRTRLSDFTFTLHFHALEKEMVAHSSVLAWRIPGTGEPGGLPSMGLQSRTRLK